MSANIATENTTSAPRPRAAKTAGGPKLGQTADAAAKRMAAAILEVLAGVRTPLQAATALVVSLPRYYQLESRALQALVQACVPKPKGRMRSAASEVTALRQQNERLQRELTRQQSLVRVAQRTVGLPPPVSPAKAPGKKRRRAVARALAVARRLEADAGTAPMEATAAVVG